MTTAIAFPAKTTLVHARVAHYLVLRILGSKGLFYGHYGDNGTENNVQSQETK